MKALKDIEVAFVCMNLPYTMTPEEAGECVAAFKPKILVPYHYRGQNPAELEGVVKDAGVTVERLRFY
jgi:L-ascorbate metabolism protein UlaG (beta-lactamase superfamily)